MSDIKRFRLLIVGKTGCGKTTVLSKVCGEDVADRPSTSRGVHDIERELLFRHNDKLVAHDSEGFEAGQGKEVEVVSDFIARRGAMEDVNKRLHMVWYCVEMSARPIQHTEREFFSTLKQAPVIAVVTKFDVFVQDILQELEEAAEEEGREVDDDELETQAAQIAASRFKEYYSAQLEDLPFPPKAIVTLSRTHESKPNDSRLSELIRQTMNALSPADDVQMTPERREEQHKLRDLFVTAQTADLTVKVELSISAGMGINYAKLGHHPIERERLIELWNTVWSKTNSPELFAWLNYHLQCHIDYSPRIIGHLESSDLEQIWQWDYRLMQSAELEEMVIDSVLIMKHIFLLRADDKDVVQRLIEWYSLRSATAKHVRKMLVDKHSRDPKALIGLGFEELHAMVNSLEVEVPDITLKLTPPAPSPPAVHDAEMLSQPRQTLMSNMSKLFKRKRAGKKV